MLTSNCVQLRQHEGIATITIDNPPVNASSQAVRQGLLEALEAISKDASITGVILACAGRTFMAGADIREFTLDEIPSPDPNDIQAALDALTVPVVAALHGSVLGGGLELALACHYRVAASGTRLGLPEVTLGVIPGGGGTQRLPRLVGLAQASDMVVRGRPVTAQSALDMGLVDAVYEGDIHAQALAFLKTKQDQPLQARVLSAHPLAYQAPEREQLNALLTSLPAEDKEGNAARACVQALLLTTQDIPFDEALKRERALFMACKNTTESQALRHACFAEREAARIPGLSKDIEHVPVQNIAVIGAGTMGIGISMSFANAGYPVTLQDISAEGLARAEQTIRQTYDAAVEKNRLSKSQADACVRLITTTTEDKALENADLIIEAVYENMALKRQIFQRLGEVAKADAILASNTSSLDINVLAQDSGRPQQVLGMHFFSPAHIMKLLEVVRGDETSPTILATVMALARKIRKVAVVSGVCFGFIGNRMLEGYLREAEALILEGATPEFIDSALEAYGMAMGPCRMIDMAGVDVAAKVVLEQKESGLLPEDASYRVVVQQLFELGRHGQKTQAGYYRYEGRRPQPDPDTKAIFTQLAEQHGISQRTDITEQEVVERCLYPLIAEGYRILEEGIAYRTGDIDTVWLNGYGFPRYRGGPMFYAQTLGLSALVARMRYYAQQTNDTFGYWEVPAQLAKAASA